jgi:hypothetical protein
VIELAGMRPLIVMAAKGFDHFANDVSARVPGVPIDIGRFGRLFERWSGRGGYGRDR